MKRAVFFIILCVVIGATTSLISFTSGPAYNGKAVTGAPEEGTCYQCHSSEPLNSGEEPFEMEFNLGVNSYTPGETYTIEFEGGENVRYGYSLVALTKNTNEDVGTFVEGVGYGISKVEERTYVEHQGVYNVEKWTIQWKAPEVDKGNVIFYIAGVEIGPPHGSPVGEKVYTRQLEISSGPISVDEIPNELSSSVFLS